MALHDGLVNWPLLFGCVLVAFGPIAALFFTVIARRAQLVILALAGAFTWMVAVLVTATIWQIPGIKTSLEATIVIGVVVQEGFRLLFFHLYTRTEQAVHAVTTHKHQLPLNDITSSLAGGVGFALMHALMMYGSLLAGSTGARGAAFSSACESIPLVFAAALSTLALTLLEAALMVVAFHAYRNKSVLAVAAVVVIHLGVALSVRPLRLDRRRFMQRLTECGHVNASLCLCAGAGEQGRERLPGVYPSALRGCVGGRRWRCGHHLALQEAGRLLDVDQSRLASP
jgi:anterior pharynx defective protein 1